MLLLKTCRNCLFSLALDRDVFALSRLAFNLGISCSFHQSIFPILWLSINYLHSVSNCTYSCRAFTSFWGEPTDNLAGTFSKSWIPVDILWSRHTSGTLLHLDGLIRPSSNRILSKATILSHVIKPFSLLMIFTNAKSVALLSRVTPNCVEVAHLVWSSKRINNCFRVFNHTFA